MTKQRIGIVGMGSISPLGHQAEEVWDNYQRAHTCLVQGEKNGYWRGQLTPNATQQLDTLRAEGKPYNKLDKTALLAITSAEQAIKGLALSPEANWGVNIGSSRGATTILEEAQHQFLAQEALSPNTSPLSTLGNVSSWVAQRLGVQAMSLSHSVTCSSALHAIANGISWLESGRCDCFLAGGAEAPLTPFTIAQMQALRIYAPSHKTDFPCRAMDLRKDQNSMVLGEAAASFVLTRQPDQKPLAWVEGLGFAMEPLSSPTSISANGSALQKAMKMALEEANLDFVDVIVSHTPGTVRGDQAEYHAIQTVFPEKCPLITNNKWKIGHSLGASGALSLEMALLMLKNQTFITLPFRVNKEGELPSTITTVMVNATGFGGNAISLILSKPEQF